MDTSATFTLQAQAGASAGTDGTSATPASGCAKLDAGVAITAGAIGAIKPIFDDGVTFTIFSKDVNIVEVRACHFFEFVTQEQQKCFGTPATPPTKRVAAASMIAKRDLLCPSSGEGGSLENVISLRWYEDVLTACPCDSDDFHNRPFLRAAAEQQCEVPALSVMRWNR